MTTPSLSADARPEGRKWLTLSVVALGTFMSTLDSSIVSVSLPSIGRDFGVGIEGLQWVVTAYLLGLSSLLLGFGRLADMVGRGRVYRFGFIIFTAGSLLCGLAPSVEMLALFRVIQAFGGAMLMANGSAIVTAAFPPRERGRALGLLGSCVAAGLTVGPPLGGFLSGTLGWRFVFYINLPVGILATFASLTLLEREPKPGSTWRGKGLDWTGGLLFAAATVLLVLTLSAAGGGSPFPAPLGLSGGLAAALALGAAFIWWELHSAEPIMELSLLSRRLFAAGNASSFLSYMGIYGVLFLMPFYLEHVLGLPPQQSGLVLLTIPLTLSITAPLSGWLSDKMGSRLLCFVGLGLATVAALLLSGLGTQGDPGVVAPRLFLLGLGFGFFQAPNNSAVMGAVPRSRLGTGSAFLATMRTFGMVTGVAVISSVFLGREAAHTLSLTQVGMSGVGLEREAFVAALHDAFLVVTAIWALGAGISLIRGGKEREAEKRGTREVRALD